MHPTRPLAAAAAALALAAQAASAQFVVDGSITQAEYGVPIVVQDTPTQFGDNQGELNAAFADYTPGVGLSLGLTGNLEQNGNGLVIFLDSKPGGGIASVDENGFGTFGAIGGARTDDFGTDTDGADGGLDDDTNTPSILDPGFNPDYSIEINGFEGTYFVNVIDLTRGNDADPNIDRFLGGVAADGSSTTATYTLDGDVAVGDVTFAFDNSNTVGVNGFDNDNPPGDLGDPFSAVTGFEALFSEEFLMTLGSGQTSIKLLPFITSGGGDFLSNQFLPGVNGDGNFGGPGFPGGDDRLFDASVLDGDQFFELAVIEGDANYDGVVNLADFGLLRAGFGQTSTVRQPADFNLDGVINLADFGVLRANFGSSVTPAQLAMVDAWAASVVPEPTTLGLLAAGSLTLLGRRR
jgi:hypothetical protein